MAVDNRGRHAEALKQVALALDEIQAARGKADAWEVFHIDVAIRCIGDRMYEAADAYAKKATVPPALRDDTELSLRADKVTLQQLRDALRMVSKRDPGSR